MKNTPRKNPTTKSTILASLQLLVHFGAVSPLYWVFGQKESHREELADAEIAMWSRTHFGKTNREIYEELATEDAVAAMHFAMACKEQGVPIV